MNAAQQVNDPGAERGLTAYSVAISVQYRGVALS